MTIEKKENSVWPGFPKNDPSVTDTVYVQYYLREGEKMGCINGSNIVMTLHRSLLAELPVVFMVR